MKAGDRVGLLVDRFNSSMKIYKNGKDLGFMFQNNETMKSCGQLYPTL